MMEIIMIHMKKIALNKKILFYSILSLGSTILNYLFQIYLGKNMLVADYGSYNSINAFCTNLTCFFAPVSVYLCREVAQKGGDLFDSKEDIINGAVFTFIISIIEVIVLSTMFGFGYADRFGTKNGMIVPIILINIFAGIITLLNGVFQGASRFVTMGVLTLMMIAFKFAFVVCVPLKDGSIVPVIAILMSNCLIAIIGSRILINILKKKKSHFHTSIFEIIKKYIKLYSATFLINTIISPYLNGGEIVIMSGKYDLSEVGVYSLASTIGKASIYLITILTTVMLPKIANMKACGNGTKELYFKSIGICFAVGLGWILFIRTVGIQMIYYILGEAYYNALLNVKYIALWVINLGVLIMVNTYYLAINELKKYLLVLSIISGVLYFVLKLCTIEFWNVPLLIGGATSFIIIWSIIDVLKAEVTSK